MARPRRRHPALAGIDEAALAEFRAGIRRRYTDEQILEQLRASAERLGRSPTMREFAADKDAAGVVWVGRILQPDSGRDGALLYFCGKVRGFNRLNLSKDHPQEGRQHLSLLNP